MDPTFPPLKRIGQQLTDEECSELLSKETRGVLSLRGTNGYPYAFPINFYFEKEENRIIFHCGKEGYKLDCIQADPRAAFTVTEQGEKKEGNWWYTARSVIAFGKIEILSDPARIADLSRKLSAKFTSDEAYVEREISLYLPKTICLSLSIEHLSGKRVKEK
ncbi:MAG: pyridoxamine 5'-phosphate oxidase family protein [Clostridia bacterium]|nr:pyridoxamine 5'-phosphate oxidase family protein [Clostridia bacterium]